MPLYSDPTAVFRHEKGNGKYKRQRNKRTAFVRCRDVRHVKYRYDFQLSEPDRRDAYRGH